MAKGITNGVGLDTEFLISCNRAAAAVGGGANPLSLVRMCLLSLPGDNAGDECREDVVRIGGVGGTAGGDSVAF